MDRTSDYWQDYSYETYSSKDFDEDSDDVRYGFSKTVMDKSSDEYNLVLQKFQRYSTSKKFSLRVTKVEKVTNEELLQKFERNKLGYKQMYGHVKVVEVFHGTKRANITSILTNNLQPKFHGQNIGHRFGAGVAFSAFASYASNYCDEENSQMLLCNVLVANITDVPETKCGRVLDKPPFIEGVYPPMRYDTTAKNKNTMDVIVKFENHEFIPAYVIHFLKIDKSLHSPYGSLPMSRLSNLPEGSGDAFARDRQSRPSEVPSSQYSRRRILPAPTTSYATVCGGSGRGVATRATHLETGWTPPVHRSYPHNPTPSRRPDDVEPHPAGGFVLLIILFIIVLYYFGIF